MTEGLSNYKPNSHKSKKAAVEGEKTDRPEITQVVKGASERKKPLGKRIAETFTGDDARSVLDYVVLDLIVPTGKALFLDALSQGGERLLFGGGSRPRSTSLRGGSNRPDYGRMYSGKPTSNALRLLKTPAAPLS